MAAEKDRTAVYYEILEFMIHYYHPDDYYFCVLSSDSLYMIGQFHRFSGNSPEESHVTCQQIEHLLKTKSIVKKCIFRNRNHTAADFDISKKL